MFLILWRKEVVLKKQSIPLYVNELLFSSLVLSYSPKSERAWSHRRWVIKAISGKRSNLQEILENESEHVKRIAEKSKMNYRAWNHRCWLVSYMARSQRLLSRLIEDSWHEQDSNANPVHTAELSQIWKEELTWSETLIKRYIGREALWLYRRFLSLTWIKHFTNHTKGTHSDSFMDNEIQLFRSCATIPDNIFEDYQSQATFAATYMLWLIKQTGDVETLNKVGEEVEELLKMVCPEKAFLCDLLVTKIMDG